MRFDIIKGAPFEWLKLKTTNIAGTIHLARADADFDERGRWRFTAAADGFAYFDFRVPHEGADYQFAVNVTNVNLHQLAVDVGLVHKSSRRHAGRTARRDQRRTETGGR